MIKAMNLEEKMKTAAIRETITLQYYKVDTDSHLIKKLIEQGLIKLAYQEVIHIDENGYWHTKVCKND